MINNTSGQDEVISKSVNNKPWKKITIGSLVVIAITWLGLPTLNQWMGGVPSIEANTISRAKVFKGTLIRDVAVSGKLVAANAPTLYSSEAGQVSLFAKPGDVVKKGTIVASILSPELQSTVKQARATLERLKIESSRGELSDNEALLDLERSLDSAKITYNASVRELTRAELSFDKKVISELELVTKQDTKTESELLLKHAQKRVDLSKKRLAFESQTRQFFVKSQQLIVDELQRRVELLDIKAPVDGVVGNWLVQKKERVANTQPIMTIVDLSQYEAELNVPEFYADDLGLGLDVQIKIAGKPLIGKVISISPEIKDSQVAVRVSVDNVADIQLRQNQRLNARIEFEKKDNVLMVKRGGFLSSHAGKAAYIVTDNSAQKAPISIGSQSVDFVEITSGLKAGDEIIISSSEAFQTHTQISLHE
ncbi:efflux RND transporter periplasmic adaptor subunit [Alteromonas sp. 5E99-2]|uniref:efflux RND transporter periplasmic adaptor subunit n=1 Tax=Alteromonas sp. 5E99-2 TaxID=2817683 RepID=UPI001A99A697|nr:efflux RND transporter periplasmic adaptor subunit [Alteromonas sp. 5E99-2]MBO1256060.1 efflux RND transporter periplasmic adaptor subunit [Alteromonas sp. 5E99-2]